MWGLAERVILALRVEVRVATYALEEPIISYLDVLQRLLKDLCRDSLQPGRYFRVIPDFLQIMRLYLITHRLPRKLISVVTLLNRNVMNSTVRTEKLGHQRGLFPCRVKAVLTASNHSIRNRNENLRCSLGFSFGFGFCNAHTRIILR